MPKTRQIRSATGTGALAANQAHAARLVARPYVVIKAPPHVPEGSIMYEIEDPERHARGHTRPTGATK